MGLLVNFSPNLLLVHKYPNLYSNKFIYKNKQYIYGGEGGGG